MSWQELIAFYRFKDSWVHVGLFFLGYVTVEGGHFVSRDCFIGLLITLLYLAYGYSFNQLCDRKIRFNYELMLALSPFLLSFLLCQMFVPRFSPYLIAAGILNTGYSLPAISWRRLPGISVLINAYLFGSIFLLGTCWSRHNIDWYAVSITVYIAFFFVPAQILHEICHAKEDARQEHYSRNYSRYLAVAMLAGVFQIGFCSYLYLLWDLRRLFLITGVLFWCSFLLLILSQRAIYGSAMGNICFLRQIFKISGMLYGGLYLLSFLG